MTDENSFLFDAKDDQLILEIKDFIEKRMAESKVLQTTPSAFSLSDELQKLADLKEKGLLSAKEFQAAKNRLIGQ